MSNLLAAEDMDFSPLPPKMETPQKKGTRQNQ